MTKVDKYKQSVIQYVKDCNEDNETKVSAIIDCIVNDDFNNSIFKEWYLEELKCAEECNSYTIIDMVKFIKTSYHNRINQRRRRSQLKENIN